ncbi:uncharacterized protein BJ212DRAFT_418713 [Suillus subaureus]|uniref:Uncharacterized protein n=1 Tax=Suillus subaureus TaxID=48587 RepID=A0A9P7JBQ4_9AGAM|nr:uncharacterized protein BJ212DRAFT_418713 [Suillus subaureus]KAG1813219.1 hypothetical protein BJ212DRAFT_418713 [Suillus subaureus]
MRLPSYRSSHMLRYHPYPRVGLSQREILTYIIEENDALLMSHATLGTMLFVNIFIVKHIDDQLSNHNTEYEDTLNVLNLPDNEEQEETAPNLLEAAGVPEAGGGLCIRRRKLMTFIIVVLLFVVRNLAFNAQCAAFHIMPSLNLHSSSVDSLSTCIS